MLTLLLPDQVEANWPLLEVLLSPAIAYDEARTVMEVYRDLLAGQMALFVTNEQACRGVAVIEFAPSETAEKCCWLAYVAGDAHGGPKAQLATMRDLAGRFEVIARGNNCTEMRVRGRDWSRVLTDYEPTGNGRHELRKAI